jgi:ankyrin repeat protein
MDRDVLMIASYLRHTLIVDKVLQREDVEVDSKDSERRKPFSIAAEMGHESIVQVLLQREEIDVDSKDSEGRTSFSFAAESGQKIYNRILSIAHTFSSSNLLSTITRTS